MVILDKMSSQKSNLRRSQTISVGDYSPLDNEDQTPKSVRPESSTSCQALKHAVSSLTRLDDFKLENIGRGFFAEVFKVTHKSTGQVMALKMNTNSGNRLNMLREVQLMNRLSHPNILRFLGVCVHEGQLHALTEFMNGGSLDQVISNKDFEMPWTLRISLSVDIACGMTYLHSRGIFHRDLTSRNVLLRVTGDVYTAVVGDFGLAAKIPDPLDKSTKLSIVGSPYWMAPEILNSQWYCEQADVFSFGIIACEITARVDADPDFLPRTKNYGVDYRAFCEKVEYCPLDYLRLAFTCCQVNPTKRPTFSEIVTSLEKIKGLLENDEPDNQRKRKESGHRGHKRSKSADNIISSTVDEAPLTPQILGEVMSKDDPFYAPAEPNPFAAWKTYGGKIIGTSRGWKDSFGLPSPSDPHTPPCTPISPDDTLSRRRQFRYQQTQSLPSSPLLLRKAAEQFHQESLHGSNCRRNSSVNQNRLSGHFTFPKSKSSNILPESLADRLQNELNNQVFENSCGQRTRRKLYANRQMSADGDPSDLSFENAQRYSSDESSGIYVHCDSNVSNGQVYPNGGSDYTSSVGSTDSFPSIEEQRETLSANYRNPKVFFSDSVSEESQTTVTSDGAVIDTHL